MTRRLGLAVLAAGLALALFGAGFLAGCGASGENPRSYKTSTSVAGVGSRGVAGSSIDPARSGSRPWRASSPVPRVTETARRGALRVILTYPREGEAVVEARLQIFLSGRRVVDDHLLPLCAYCAVVPAGMWGGSSLAIRDLDGDGRAEVLVELGLGGVHDIPYTFIYFYKHAYWFSGSGTFDRLVHIWGGFGVHRRDLRGDGRLEFVSHDPRFFGAFACLGCSAGPIQIWQFQHGRLLDVTRRFPAAVRRDLVLYRSCLPNRAPRGEDERGCLAGWAGDQALLGRSRLIWPMLEAARKHGNLGVGYRRAPLVPPPNWLPSIAGRRASSPLAGTATCSTCRLELRHC